MSDILAIDVTQSKPKMEIQEVTPQDDHGSNVESKGETKKTKAKPKAAPVLTGEVEEEVIKIPEPHEEEEDLFEKPKPKKKKRQMTEKQLASLAKAREKSMARRRALKESKDLDKMEKKIARDKVREEVLAKRMESDAVLELKAKLMADAKANATWDEDRLSKLMESTIEKYVAKKKAQKPVPKVQIPAQNSYPQYAPHHQPQHQPVQQYQQRRPPRQQQGSDPVSSLFGYNQNGMYGFD